MKLISMTLLFLFHFEVQSIMIHARARKVHALDIWEFSSQIWMIYDYYFKKAYMLTSHKLYRIMM